MLARHPAEPGAQRSETVLLAGKAQRLAVLLERMKYVMAILVWAQWGAKNFPRNISARWLTA
jgi:hypothetical protein